MMRIAAFAALTAFALAGCGATSPGPAPTPAFESGQPIVLVHGAWAGGWQFKPIEPALRAAGYDVYRPSLPGLGEHHHLADAAIDLDTHIADIVELIRFERLENVVLLGFSYGGAVITGVADRIPERIDRLIYLDAVVLQDGESVADVLPALSTRTTQGPWLVPTWADTTVVPRDMTQSLATFTQPLALRRPPGQGLPVSYILTAEGAPEDDAFAWAAERAQRYGWDVRVMEGGHVVTRTAPDALADLLLEIVRAGRRD